MKPLTLTAPKPKRTLKKLSKKPYAAKEWHEQRTVFEWAKMMEPSEPRLKLLNGSMNGIQVSNPAIIVRAKLCGLKPGYPDIFLPVQGYGCCPGLFIELKRKGGKPVDDNSDQGWWLNTLHDQGFQTVVAFGADDAIRIIKDYLEMED